MKQIIKAITIICILLASLTSSAQDPDTTLTIEEVEIRADIINKGGIVEFFSEIFDLQLLKKSFFTYNIGWNQALRNAKNALEDSTGIHIYIRPYIDDPAFWPDIFKKIAGHFYVDKIHPSLEYKPIFSIIDTSLFEVNIDPIAIPLDPNDPVDFGRLDDDISMSDQYDSLRAQVIDTLIQLFTNADSIDVSQDSSAWLVDFFPAQDQSYGYDQFLSDDKYAALRPTYVLHEGRYLSYKSIKANSTDHVLAYCRTDTLDVKFKKDDGSPLPSFPAQGDTLRVDISASLEGEFGLIAYYEEGENDIEIGRVRIVGYPGEQYNVVLVPTNGHSYTDISSLGAIQTKLNKIFAQAVVSWTVTPGNNIPVLYDNDGVETFNAVPADNQQYTTDMQHVIDQLNANPPENTYYIFILDEAEPFDGQALMGMMPFFQPYGFVFLNACGDEEQFIKTIAHELGHGTFGLEHEFFLYPAVDDRDPNMMNWHLTDVSLKKYQWDWIQNPFCMIEGNCGQGGAPAMVGETNVAYDFNFEDEISPIEQMNICKTHVTPAGNPIGILNIKGANFTTNVELANPLPENALYSFSTEIDGITKEYTAIYSCHNINDENPIWYFKGYIELTSEWKDLSDAEKREAIADDNVLYYIEEQECNTYGYDEFLPYNVYISANEQRDCSIPKDPEILLYTGEGRLVSVIDFDNNLASCSDIIDPEHECYDTFCEIAGDNTKPGHEYTVPGNHFYNLIIDDPCLLEHLLPFNNRSENIQENGLLREDIILSRTRANRENHAENVVQAYADKLDSYIFSQDVYVYCSGGIDNIEHTVRVFDDKFYVFKHETGKSIYVIRIPLDYYPEISGNDFAEQVAIRSMNFNANTMTLITVPYYDYFRFTKNINNDWEKVDYQYNFPGTYGEYSQNTADYTGFTEYLNNFYKQVPKPFKNYTYTLMYDGSVISSSNVIESGQTGYPYIYSIYVQHDARIEAHQSAISFGEILKIVNYSNAAADRIINFTNELEQWDDPNYVPTYNHIPNKKIRLSETGIMNGYHEIYAVEFLEDDYEDMLPLIDYINGLKNYVNFNEGIPDEYLFLESTYDLILNTLDGVGLALSVIGADCVTDFIGFVIAATNADGGNTVIYGMALVVEGASAKTIKELGKRVFKFGDIVIAPGTEAYKNSIKTLLNISEDAANAINKTKSFHLFHNPTLVTRIKEIPDIKRSNLITKVIANPSLMVHTQIKPDNVNFISNLLEKDVPVEKIDNILKKFANKGNYNDDVFNVVKNLEGSYINQFADDIANPNYALKDLFEESPSDITNIWKELKDNPYSKLDFVEETTNSRWLKWKDREFFLAVTEKGRTFNTHMKPRIKNDLVNKGADLTGCNQIEEFHVIGENGSKVIMDNAFVKAVKNEAGITQYYKVIYNDNKFGNLSSWTPNQKTEVINYFKNNPSKEFITMEVRTSDDLLEAAGITTLNQGDNIRLYRQDVYKTLSNGDNSNPVFQEIINMNAVNFAD